MADRQDCSSAVSANGDLAIASICVKDKMLDTDQATPTN
jgi:hypothetical protein